jgi:ubiquinone/menaquinone biosynthesis C-methylase UbiE
LSKKIVDAERFKVTQKRTLCEVLREVFDLIDDPRVPVDIHCAAQNSLEDAYTMAKKMDKKLHEYKYNWDETFWLPNPNYHEDLKRRWQFLTDSSYPSIQDGYVELRQILDLTETKSKDLEFLDVGCGAGHVVFAATQSGLTAVGLEPDASRVKYNINWVPGKAEKIPFSNNYFDLVSSVEVLDHVQDWRQTIKEIYRVTKKGGKIYVSMPNYLIPYEHHYHFFFVPMPKKLAVAYFKATQKLWNRTSRFGKPPQNFDYIKTLNYITSLQVKKAFAKEGGKVTEDGRKLHKKLHNPLMCYFGLSLSACLVIEKR